MFNLWQKYKELGSISIQPRLASWNSDSHPAQVGLQAYLSRMVFGQPRQEDLMTYLLEQMDPEEADAVAGEIPTDLSPRGRGRS